MEKKIEVRDLLVEIVNLKEKRHSIIFDLVMVNINLMQALIDIPDKVYKSKLEIQETIFNNEYFNKVTETLKSYQNELLQAKNELHNSETILINFKKNNPN